MYFFRPARIVKVWAPYLFVGLLTLLAFGFTIPLLSWGFGFNIEGMTMLYDMAGVMLFCGYISLGRSNRVPGASRLRGPKKSEKCRKRS